jgi:hypothetical protein
MHEMRPLRSVPTASKYVMTGHPRMGRVIIAESQQGVVTFAPASERPHADENVENWLCYKPGNGSRAVMLYRLGYSVENGRDSLPLDLEKPRPFRILRNQPVVVVGESEQVSLPTD